MRRFIIFALLLILLGLSTTIGVAWLYAGIGQPAAGHNRLSTWSEHRYAVGNGWEVREWAGAGKRARVLRPLPQPVAWGNEETDSFDPPHWSAACRPAPVDTEELFEDARGWPFVALRCTWREPAHPFFSPAEVIEGGVAIADFVPDWMVVPPDPYIWGHPDVDYLSVNYRRALPLTPIWSGLIGSTLFFALAWAAVILLLNVPRMLRRIVRRRRNRCIRCAYWLKGIDSRVCPECGWEIGKRCPAVTGAHIVIICAFNLVVIAATAVFAAAVTRRFKGPDPIQLAARDNDVERARELLGKGANPDCKVLSTAWYDYSSVAEMTPLMWAAAHGGVEAMHALLEAGADGDAGDAMQRTALMHAAEYGQAKSADILIDTGVNVDIGDFSGMTALMYAAVNGHADIVKRLLEAGADVTLSDTSNETAIFHAARSPSPETVALLLQAGADLTRTAGFDDITPLCVAAGSGWVENMRLLIEGGAEINPLTDRSPLYRAIESGRTEAALLLLDRGADIDRSDRPLVWEAAENNLSGVVRRLLQEGADPNHEHPVAEGWSPLRRAVIRSNLLIAEMLVDAGADPDVEDDAGETVLFRINWDEASPKFISFVLNLGVDVNRRSHAGNTVLIQAVFDGEVEAVRALLAAGADPLVRNNSGHCALDYAEQALPYKSRVELHGGQVSEEVIRMLRTAAASR